MGHSCRQLGTPCSPSCRSGGIPCRVVRQGRTCCSAVRLQKAADSASAKCTQVLTPFQVEKVCHYSIPGCLGLTVTGRALAAGCSADHRALAQPACELVSSSIGQHLPHTAATRASSAATLSAVKRYAPYILTLLARVRLRATYR